MDYNNQEWENLGIANRIKFIFPIPDDPSLSATGVHLVSLCNVYYDVEHHADYFAKIKSALTTNGRVVIVDSYQDERSGKLSFSNHHLVPRGRVIQNMEQAGYTLSKEHTFLSRQYFLEFVKNAK